MIWFVLQALQSCEGRVERDQGSVEYRALLSQARAEALDSRDFVNLSGVDKEGRPVVCISVANIDRGAQDVDMVLRAMVLFLDAAVRSEYTVVLYLTEQDQCGMPGMCQTHWW